MTDVDRDQCLLLFSVCRAHGGGYGGYGGYGSFVGGHGRIYAEAQGSAETEVDTVVVDMDTAEETADTVDTVDMAVETVDTEVDILTATALMLEMVDIVGKVAVPDMVDMDRELDMDKDLDMDRELDMATDSVLHVETNLDNVLRS